MDAEELYQTLLNLAPPWYVKAVVAEEDAAKVLVYLGLAEAALFSCPLCGRPCDLCEHTEEKTWRHLDTCQKQTHVLARLPVVNCPEHGKQSLAHPMADARAPITSTFAQWLNRLARDLGSLKKAAVIARVSEDLLRKIIARAPEPPSLKKDPSKSDSNAVSAQYQTRQLSLFSQNDMILVNQGLRALKTLQLEQALELFRKQQRAFPKAQDVAPKIALAGFLLQGLREAPAAISERVPHLCRLWTSFEDYIRSQGTQTDDRLVSELQRSFFERIAKEIEEADLADISLIGGEIPYGYLLLQAGQYDQAIQHLQAAIAKTPNNAAIYGYLGDAYWLRGDVKTARKCYQEGCLIDPDAIDWQHMRDGALNDLRDDLLFAHGFDAELATAWLPSYARASGLFERKLIRLHDGMKEMVDDYVSLQKSLAKDANPKRLAKLFFRGIILCENEESLKLVKKIDLIEVRRVMKQANPDLFGEVLTYLGKKRE